MAGLITPPFFAGVRQVNDPAALSSGALDLALGVGLTITRDGRTTIVDGTDPKQAPPSSLFVPGTLAVRDVAKFLTTRSAPSILLRYMDVNLYTPAAAATDVDCMALRVAGTGSGAQEVKLNSTATWFGTNGYESSLISKATNGFNYVEYGYGGVSFFQTTADVTVSAIAFDAVENQPNGTNATTGGKAKVIEILSDDLQTVLGTTGEFLDPLAMYTVAASGTGFPKPLQRSVVIKQGTRFAVGLRRVGLDGNQQGKINYASNNSLESVIYNAPVSYGPAVNGNKALKLTQAAAGAGGGWNDPANYTANPADTTAHPALPTFYGGGGGVRLTGDTIISVVKYGTGGTPGADMNLRLVFDK